ncbi:hypothetical protein DFJ58DRAFT_274829 [Suillus subalutaceus]|uniref:uncharacterized protein n=1 Tax=Suillus subalutaceus TaxID=48586 RepID=UPI001B865C5F|nr:uncharacterized protein DFJ58DRAFT_274829 [Suillus subalutaceus]KAG1860285.1 hypothetical protein DFJ58DRAFT_274829 [Suillus subalutaceus]
MFQQRPLQFKFLTNNTHLLESANLYAHPSHSFSQHYPRRTTYLSSVLVFPDVAAKLSFFLIGFYFFPLTVLTSRLLLLMVMIVFSVACLTKFKLPARSHPRLSAEYPSRLRTYTTPGSVRAQKNSRIVDRD